MAAAGGFIQAGATMFSAQEEADALRRQGRFAAQAGRIQKQFSDLSAGQVERQGGARANKIRGEARKLEGSQRARILASGGDVTSGSNAALIAESRAAMENDALTTENNAWREAWGLRVQGTTAESEGRIARMTAGARADSTLLAGGLQATGQGIDSYNRYRYPRGS
jgi:hypothetical protein